MRPTQISQSAVLFYLMCPTFNYPSRKFKINYGRMDRVWCEKDCNFRPWVPFLVPSCFVQLRKSLISKPLFSRFKKQILFFCLDVASFVREVGESFSECQQTRMSHQWLNKPMVSYQWDLLSTNGNLPSKPKLWYSVEIKPEICKGSAKFYFDRSMWKSMPELSESRFALYIEKLGLAHAIRDR